MVGSLVSLAVAATAARSGQLWQVEVVGAEEVVQTVGARGLDGGATNLAIKRGEEEASWWGTVRARCTTVDRLVLRPTTQLVRPSSRMCIVQMPVMVGCSSTLASTWPPPTR